jgi:hypothetical protein
MQFDVEGVAPAGWIGIFKPGKYPGAAGLQQNNHYTVPELNSTTCLPDIVQEGRLSQWYICRSSLL